MRKKIFGLFLLLLMLVGASLTKSNAQAVVPGDWYLLVTTVVYINGEMYIESECTEQNGNDCNMPGSIHRIAFPSIWF